ncbi:rCG28377 [Rattus norvegicus]|uniref:RCG28377 n=1 Tax=Rattus norvegicus TaxID=10116 RepID=A6KTY6_RAT|nr:rCG28377 [Rattus norvegicus]
MDLPWLIPRFLSILRLPLEHSVPISRRNFPSLIPPCSYALNKLSHL